MSCNHHPGRKGIKSLRHRENCCWCIFRLKTAFDTVDHTILLGASDLLFYILFGDDTSVFSEGTNYNKVFDILNKELKRVNIWLKANKLTINTKKTHYMMFHRTRIKGDHHLITIDGNPITYSNNTKFLGVIIDHKLNWSDHYYISRTKFQNQ